MAAGSIQRLETPLLRYGRGESLKAIELPDDVLSVIPHGGAVLIETEALLNPDGVLVSTMDGFKVLPFGSQTIVTAPEEGLSR